MAVVLFNVVVPATDKLLFIVVAVSLIENLKVYVEGGNYILLQKL